MSLQHMLVGLFTQLPLAQDRGNFRSEMYCEKHKKFCPTPVAAAAGDSDSGPGDSGDVLKMAVAGVAWQLLAS